MRKHYVTGVLGIILFATLISLQSTVHCDAPANLNVTDSICAKATISDKIGDVVRNAVAGIVNEGLDWLTAK